MTVSTTLNKVIYPGTGAQTTFSFSFAFPGGTATQEGANILVFYTDTLGNITQLVQGPGSANYQITFNPASGTNPTPTGGIVTYNPSGVPIALGTFLTVLRSLPLTQSTSLQNQGTLYQPVTEAALDYEMMVSQQVLEVQSRALVVSVSDPTPSALPAVASRKNLFLAFDSLGNPIASQPSGANTPISSAMVPVVTAATLAAGRSAFGLGAIATEGIGQGLSDDGFGSVRLSMLPVGDSSPVTVVGATAFTRRLLFANVTYTIPLSSTLYNGFGFWIDTNAFTATLSINAADTFSGMSTGVALLVGPGESLYVYTNAAGSWFINKGVLPGFNSAQNLQINASVSASALTISLKDRNGNDPSATSPIVTTFSLFGNNVSRALSAPLSITVPSGATIGTVNGQANRIWLGLFDNGGTLVLGVYNSLSGSNVLAWDETAATTTTAISAGSTSPQTWYTQGGALSAKALRILGFIESIQPTAGAWTVAPYKVQLFGPGIKKPGDIVQEVNNSNTTQDSTSSATFVVLTHNEISISVQSAPDVIRVEALGSFSFLTGGIASLQLSRGVVANSGLIGSFVQGVTVNGTGNPTYPAMLMAYDIPNAAGSVTYAVQGREVGAGPINYPAAGATVMVAREIFI
jgi:hypothetical protein